MTPEGKRPKRAIDPREALNLLDAGHIPALAIDAPEHLIRSMNASLAKELGLNRDAIEGEGVHTIVAEEHHEFVEAVLETVGRGATVGPTWISVRARGGEATQPCIFARIPRISRVLEGTVVFLCKPAETSEIEAPLDPKGDLGFGRIPPSPPSAGEERDPERH